MVPYPVLMSYWPLDSYTDDFALVTSHKRYFEVCAILLRRTIEWYYGLYTLMCWSNQYDNNMIDDKTSFYSSQWTELNKKGWGHIGAPNYYRSVNHKNGGVVATYVHFSIHPLTLQVGKKQACERSTHTVARKLHSSVGPPCGKVVWTPPFSKLLLPWCKSHFSAGISSTRL